MNSTPVTKISDLIYLGFHLETSLSFHCEVKLKIKKKLQWVKTIYAIHKCSLHSLLKLVSNAIVSIISENLFLLDVSINPFCGRYLAHLGVASILKVIVIFDWCSAKCIHFVFIFHVIDCFLSQKEINSWCKGKFLLKLCPLTSPLPHHV